MQLVTTPKGIYALEGDGKVWLCKVEKQGQGREETFVPRWSKVSDNGPKSHGSENDAAVYDSKRNRLAKLIHTKAGPEMWFFGLDNLKAVKSDAKGALAGCWSNCYIPDQDVILVVRNDEKAHRFEQAVYRCGANEWIRPDLPMPAGPGSGEYDVGLAWDPVHKVAVLMNPQGFSGPTTMYLLSYDDKQVTLAGGSDGRERAQ
jgi:hypothetical protein